VKSLMPRLKKPHIATLDEVRITREADAAIIEYHDATVASTRLLLGQGAHSLSDAAILEIFNSTILARERAVSEHGNVVREVPRGMSQVSYFDKGDQWVPRGEVLRCVIEDGGPGGEVKIWIDDREFTLQEFGRMLTTFAGWGMRIYFVPDEKVHEQPTVEVRPPEE
jgi:hypothetical protein